jgi:hypothetical protein
MSADLHVHMTPSSSKTYTEAVFLGRTERAKLAMPDGCAKVYMSMKSVMEAIVNVRHSCSMILTGLLWIGRLRDLSNDNVHFSSPYYRTMHAVNRHVAHVCTCAP